MIIHIPVFDGHYGGGPSDLGESRGGIPKRCDLHPRRFDHLAEERRVRVGDLESTLHKGVDGGACAESEDVEFGEA